MSSPYPWGISPIPSNWYLTCPDLSGTNKDMQINPHALRALRERSGYSIRQFAAASGVPKTTIAETEAGHRNPSPATVKKLADCLQVPIVAITHMDEATA